MRPLPTRPVLAVLMLLFPLATAVPAVEVRRLETPILYKADLVRAYAPCTAPNTVTSHGQPACAPTVTSACNFRFGSIEINDVSFATVRASRLLVNDPQICTDGEYRLALTYRATFANDGDDTVCESASCTTVDTTELSAPFDLRTNAPNIVGFGGFRGNGNYEILGAELIAPDGLPMAAAAPSSSQNQQFQNLSVGYKPCTNPLPGYQACDTEPWDSPCDFVTGTITYRATRDLLGLPSAPILQLSIQGLSGSSPLCTNSGAYELETRARLTVADCGPTGDDECTLPDAAYVSLLSGAIGFPGVDSSLIRTAQLLGFRLFDPTGAALAAAAVTDARLLTNAHFTTKADQLRVRAVFPPNPNDELGIDPTNDDGATFTLHDRTGVIHTVTIPAATWQLQPPLGERWEYKDPGGVRAGVRKIRIKLKQKRGVPIGFDVQLAANGVDLSGADLAAATLTMTIARRENEFTATPITAQTTRACKLKGQKRACE